MKIKLTTYLMVIVTFFSAIFSSFASISICFHDVNSFHLFLGSHDLEACRDSCCEESELSSLATESCSDHCIDETFYPVDSEALNSNGTKRMVPPGLINTVIFSSNQDLLTKYASISQLRSTSLILEQGVLTTILKI